MFEIATGPPPLPSREAPLLSLAMIVKDGGQLFAELLAEAAPHVDEMVIGDTGSSDGSGDVARAAGAHVLDIPWQNDFSHARNAVLEACRGRWILIMEDDEKLAPGDWQALRTWVEAHRSGRDACAGRMVTRNYVPGHHTRRGWRATPRPDAHGLPGGPVAAGFVPTWKVRLFPNRPDVRIAGHIHETVEAALKTAGVPEEDLLWPVHHWGYLEEDPAKSRFYLDLARRKTKENPESCHAWGERADAALSCEEREEALEALDRCLTLQPGDMERRLLFAWVLKETGREAQAEMQFKAVAGSPTATNCQLAEACHAQAQMALEADDPELLSHAGTLLALALRLNPDHGPQLNSLGVWHLRLGHGEEGRQALEKAAALMPGEPDPLLNLAVLYAAANQPDRARDHVREVLALQPEHERAQSLARRLQIS